MYEYNLQIFRILNILGIFLQKVDIKRQISKGRNYNIRSDQNNKQIFIVHFLKVELENIDRLLKLVSENSLIYLKRHCLYKQIYKYFYSQGLSSEKEKKEKFQISES